MHAFLLGLLWTSDYLITGANTYITHKRWTYMPSVRFEPMIPIIKQAADLRRPHGYQELMFLGLNLAELIFNFAVLSFHHLWAMPQFIGDAALLVHCYVESPLHCLLSSAAGFEILRYCSTCHIFRQTEGGYDPDEDCGSEVYNCKGDLESGVLQPLLITD